MKAFNQTKIYCHNDAESVSLGVRTLAFDRKKKSRIFRHKKILFLIFFDVTLSSVIHVWFSDFFEYRPNSKIKKISFFKCLSIFPVYFLKIICSLLSFALVRPCYSMFFTKKATFFYKK